MKAIFLDFDGVLFDTVLESYLLARYAYSGISPFEKVNEKEYKIFHENRYLITNSWHYYYIMKIIEENIINKSIFKNKYLSYIANRDIQNEKLFDKKFQAMRGILINKHYNFWKHLDRPYKFLEELKKIDLKSRIYILSTKNKLAIINRLKDYQFLIDENNIIDKDILKNYNSKGEFLNKFINKNNIDSAIFIDDSMDNLDSCKDITNLDCYLADWGYTEFDGYSENEVISIIKELEQNAKNY